MKQLFLRLGLISIAASMGSFDAGAGSGPPRVVAAINPVHSLVAGVMDGVGTPRLLVRGGASPHAYAMKPSDARALRDADLVFWIGEDMETFLPKALSAHARKGAAVALSKAKEVRLLSVRAGGTWNVHGHGKLPRATTDHGPRDASAEHPVPDRKRGPRNMHIWLDPINAKAMVSTIAAALARVDLGNSTRYRANAKKMRDQLDALDATLRRELSAVAAYPYVVFHDAYRYFENRYGLNAVGSITVSPEIKPGAKRLRAIRRQIASLGAVCVFSEPQFEPALMTAVLRGTTARSAVLDPLGAGLAPGPSVYRRILLNLSRDLRGCLQPDS